MKSRHRRSTQFTLQKKGTVKKKDTKAAPRMVFNTFLIVFAAIILGFGVTQFCVQSVFMTGPSMESVISDGDEVILNKMAYRAGKVKRFDIVAIKKIGSTDYYDIKRVVAIPGDTVSVVGGRLVINGKHVNEKYGFSYINSAGVLSGTVKLGDGEYFCLGDNPSNSEDSRFVNYGNIQKSEIKGRITYRVFPKERRGKISR